MLHMYVQSYVLWLVFFALFMITIPDEKRCRAKLFYVHVHVDSYIHVHTLCTCLYTCTCTCEDTHTHSQVYFPPTQVGTRQLWAARVTHCRPFLAGPPLPSTGHGVFSSNVSSKQHRVNLYVPYSRKLWRGF